MDDGSFGAGETKLSRAFNVRFLFLFSFLLLTGAQLRVRAQIDPDKRQLVHIGYNQPLEGKGPLAIYGFYYRNQPNFLNQTNLTLRLAIAPLYVDAELGMAGFIGPNTDLAFGLAGGGYADSYFEVRKGQYIRGESFDGHGAEGSVSVYHRFNPDAEIPLNGVFRLAARSLCLEEPRKPHPAFGAPDVFQSLSLRPGLRYGGREP